MTVQRRLQLQNSHGLHARPISQVVQTAARHAARLTVRHQGRDADGRSILEMMSLGAGPGAEIELIADGTDAEDLIQALVDLVEARFGEG